MFYDLHRQAMISFAHGVTYEYDSTKGVWINLEVDSPPERFGHCVGYDLDRQVGLLFGGVQSGKGPVTDTWEWDSRNAEWTHVDEGTGSGGNGASMAYDARRHEMLRFGGIGSLPDLSTFDPREDSWITRFASPLFTRYSVLTFDSGRNVTVLFTSAPEFLGATWEWDGETWTHVPAAGPSLRTGAMMVYDSSRHVSVLFGGNRRVGGGPDLPSNQTWEWDGRSWVLAAENGPAPRFAHALAFDSTRNLTVMFGGRDDGGSGGRIFSDTWVWDGKSWREIAGAGPSARFGSAMTFDAVRGVTVLFGGDEYPFTKMRDTWEFNGETWTKRADATGPPEAGPMTFDSRQGIVQCFSDGAWLWNGVEWVRRWADLPTEFAVNGVAYDAARNVTVLLSADHELTLQEHWELAPIPSACPGDANLDGEVDGDDLLMVILAWGPCPPPPAPFCAADLDGDGDVDADDLILVIVNWTG
jgi:hypothetical protein